jgi:AraC-like DNA-binding protein
MEARILRLGLAIQEKRRFSSGPRANARRNGGLSELKQDRLSKVEQIAAFIAMHYKERLAVEDVGEHVGLHPNHAMMLFKRAFGTTVLNYLTQHRISHAQRLLATTRDKILAIALDSGFGSVSRFNAAFKTNCGCSPREYRARHYFSS